MYGNCLSLELVNPLYAHQRFICDLYSSYIYFLVVCLLVGCIGPFFVLLAFPLVPAAFLGIAVSSRTMVKST